MTKGSRQLFHWLVRLQRHRVEWFGLQSWLRSLLIDIDLPAIQSLSPWSYQHICHHHILHCALSWVQSPIYALREVCFLLLLFSPFVVVPAIFLIFHERPEIKLFALIHVELDKVWNFTQRMILFKNVFWIHLVVHVAFNVGIVFAYPQGACSEGGLHHQLLLLVELLQLCDRGSP